MFVTPSARSAGPDAADRRLARRARREQRRAEPAQSRAAAAPDHHRHRAGPGRRRRRPARRRPAGSPGRDGQRPGRNPGAARRGQAFPGQRQVRDRLGRQLRRAQLGQRGLLSRHRLRRDRPAAGGPGRADRARGAGAAGPRPAGQPGHRVRGLSPRRVQDGHGDPDRQPAARPEPRAARRAAGHAERSAGRWDRRRPQAAPGGGAAPDRSWAVLRRRGAGGDAGRRAALSRRDRRHVPAPAGPCRPGGRPRRLCGPRGRRRPSQPGAWRWCAPPA